MTVRPRRHSSLLLLSSGLAFALVSSCQRARPSPKADAEVSRKSKTAEARRPKVPSTFVGRKPLSEPGRVVMHDLIHEPRGSVFYVAVDGTRHKVDVDGPVFSVAPYDHGHGLLARTSGDHLLAIPVAGGDPVENEFSFDESIVAIADGGRAGLFAGYDMDRRSSTVQLWDLRTGKGAGFPVPKFERCPVGTGDVSLDGTEAIVACRPCECSADLSGCEVALCRLRIEGHVAEEVRTGRGPYFAPVYTPDGRIVFASGEGDGRPACEKRPQRCRQDLVAVLADDPAAEPTVLVTGATAARFSRISGRLIHAVADDEGKGDCEAWPCTKTHLAVADADGKNGRRITPLESFRLPPQPVSLDDHWIAFTAWTDDDQPHGRACRVDEERCVDLGPGVVSGWVRDAGQTDVPDPSSFFGCWRIDHEALVRANEIPQGLAPARFREVIEGVRLRLGASEMTLWIDTQPEGRHFEQRFVARHTVHAPRRLMIELEAPTDLDETRVAPGKIPPLRIDRHGRITFERDADGNLESAHNFLLRALWGTDTGPLRLMPTPCPADAPSGAAGP